MSIAFRSCTLRRLERCSSQRVLTQTLCELFRFAPCLFVTFFCGVDRLANEFFFFFFWKYSCFESNFWGVDFWPFLRKFKSSDSLELRHARKSQLSTTNNNQRHHNFNPQWRPRARHQLSLMISRAPTTSAPFTSSSWCRFRDN